MTEKAKKVLKPLNLPHHTKKKWLISFRKLLTGKLHLNYSIILIPWKEGITNLTEWRLPD